MGANVNMYRLLYVAVIGEKECEREIWKLLIQAFWNVALLQLVKSEIPKEKMAHIFRMEQCENYVILFKKYW